MKRKHRSVAVLLAIFLGSFGAHRFYLRRPFSGVLHLLFFWTGIPAVLSIISAFYMALMSQARFDQKHNPVVDNDEEEE